MSNIPFPAKIPKIASRVTQAIMTLNGKEDREAERQPKDVTEYDSDNQPLLSPETIFALNLPNSRMATKLYKDGFDPDTGTWPQKADEEDFKRQRPGKQSRGLERWDYQ